MVEFNLKQAVFYLNLMKVVSNAFSRIIVAQRLLVGRLFLLMLVKMLLVVFIAVVLQYWNMDEVFMSHSSSLERGKSIMIGLYEEGCWI